MTTDQIQAMVEASVPPVELPTANGLISAAFVKAQADMPTIRFDSTNPFFKSKYASLAGLIGETRPILGKHGLAMHQTAVIKDGFVTVATQLRHTSGQTLDFGSMTMAIGDTGKSEVQAAGSLVTYLKRYSWQTALGVAADEDDDGNTAPTKQQAQAKPPSKVESTHATEKTRMWALNGLKAAPGQPLRDTVTGFLRMKGWVDGLLGEPESWRLDKVPCTTPQLTALAAEIQQFDIDRHQPAQSE